jgi:hypothetical protein
MVDECVDIVLRMKDAYFLALKFGSGCILFSIVNSQI